MNDVNTTLIEDFLSTYHSEGTKRTYGVELRKFADWLDKPLAECTQKDAIEYNKHLKARVENEKTLQRIYSTLRAFFSFLQECELVTKNPFKVLRPLTPKNTQTERILATNEIEAIKLAAKKVGAREYAMIALLATTGLRIEELVSLDWKDLYTSPDGHKFVLATRKGGQRLPVHIDKAWDALMAYKDELAANFDPNGPVFTSERNRRSDKQRLTQVGARKIIREIYEKAGINRADEISPHWFRHSFITHSLAGGAPLRDVQEAANHKSIKTTELYLHALGEGVDKYLPFTF